MENFEPVIVAFCCHYCAYTAADMAGSQRLSYPANVRIIRVPCSGKVDALHIMKAFEKGADGVCVAGCLDGDCHFRNGNVKAQKKITYIQHYLAEIGIEEERLMMLNISAGMGRKFAETATEITEKIRRLGPSPIHSALSGRQGKKM
ncbi:MAG: heterodisulfide reductase subunit MvhD [Proteobacteria bacterium]|nr:MAG: heterodisulfide reductase subunit MvhD [Pseudomonadota bacterium]PIE65184.1 MAG: heterodisulfide reductase subunit MvhD [Desulfobacterales bacterium]